MPIVLNDVRVRSAIAGGLGGFIGWTLVEPLVVPWHLCQRAAHFGAEHAQAGLPGAAWRYDVAGGMRHAWARHC